MTTNKFVQWCIIVLLGLTAATTFADFTDNHNDGVLNGWTRVGSRPWSEYGGMAVPANANPNQGFLINNNMVTDDGVLEVVCNADQWNGNRGGVVLRWTSSSSYYYVGVLPGNQWSNSITFCENSMNLATGTVVASNFAMNTTFTLKVELDGATFRFYINNVLRGQITDASHSSGQVGYGYSADWNSYTRFDNIVWTDAVPQTFELTTSVTGSGVVSPSSGTFPNGDTVVLVATPAAGWQFDYWSGDAAGSNNPLPIIMDSDKNITAHFSEVMYDLATTVDGQGSVTPASGSYPEDAVIQITAAPAAGWVFDHWSGDASGSTNPLDITMDSDKNITAHFIEIMYNLSTSVDGQGTVSPASGNYPENTVVEITATAAEGWVFDHWSGDASGSDNPMSVTMDSDKNITAHFTEIPTYDLAVTVDGQGTVSPASGNYPENTVVEITATAAEGWVFDHWSGDASGSDNPVSVTMDSDKNITAHFREIPTYDLAATVDGQGTVSPASGNYPENTVVEITATAAEGWVFDHWSGDASGSDNPMSVTMDSDKNIIAHFREIPTYDLAVTVDGQGTVSPASGNYPENTIVEITATGAEGWAFDHWSGDASGSDNPLSVTMDSDKNIIAHFTEIPTYTLTVTVDGPGSVTPQSGTFPEGTEVEITATADQYYMFDHWSSDATGDDNPLTVTMDADMNITAHFVPYVPPVPNREKLSITARLFDVNGDPVGAGTPVTLNATVSLFTDQTAGLLRYTETFLQTNGEGVTVADGRFIVRLREGTSDDDLKQVLEENPHLWVEISIDGEPLERIPLSGAAYLITEAD